MTCRLLEDVFTEVLNIKILIFLELISYIKTRPSQAHRFQGGIVVGEMAHFAKFSQVGVWRNGEKAVLRP